MSAPRSDALVIFGASGDLAYKKIFPALHAMTRRGHLDVPVVGVARVGWTLERFRARARESIERHGGGVDEAAFAKLRERLRYVSGDYGDAATYARSARSSATRRVRCTTSPSRRACSPPWSRGSGGRAARATRASSWRSRSAAICRRRRR